MQMSRTKKAKPVTLNLDGDVFAYLKAIAKLAKVSPDVVVNVIVAATLVRLKESK
jgi:phage baseplate assembly protein gpV